MLFGVLKEEEAFKQLSTWNLTEGLAEYYLKQVWGDTRFFNMQQQYAAFVERINESGILIAVQLYHGGLEAF